MYILNIDSGIKNDVSQRTQRLIKEWHLLKKTVIIQ